jgi:HemY protein
VPGIGAEWLPRLESACAALPRDGSVALAAGCALAERGLWGKARALLELAADDATLAGRAAPQGLDRTRRAGRARGRRGPRRRLPTRPLRGLG